MSPKRKQGEEGDVLYPGHKGRPRRKVTVLEMRDLEGEYLLVLARLQLIKVDADPTHATGQEANCGCLSSFYFLFMYLFQQEQ